MQVSHLTHNNAIVSVCIDLNAVMFDHCEHFLPYATQLCWCGVLYPMLVYDMVYYT